MLSLHGDNEDPHELSWPLAVGKRHDRVEHRFLRTRLPELAGATAFLHATAATRMERSAPWEPSIPFPLGDRPELAEAPLVFSSLPAGLPSRNSGQEPATDEGRQPFGRKRAPASSAQRQVMAAGTSRRWQGRYVHCAWRIVRRTQTLSDALIRDDLWNAGGLLEFALHTPAAHRRPPVKFRCTVYISGGSCRARSHVALTTVLRLAIITFVTGSSLAASQPVESVVAKVSASLVSICALTCRVIIHSSLICLRPGNLVITSAAVAPEQRSSWLALAVLTSVAIPSARSGTPSTSRPPNLQRGRHSSFVPFQLLR